MSRPQILFPLFADLPTLPGIGPKTAENLQGLDIEKPRDLLFNLPSGVVDRRMRTTLQGMDFPSIATVEVSVGAHSPPHQKGRPYRITVHDSDIAFQVVFFHANAEYLKRLLPTGQRRILSGKVELFDNVPQMVHPDHIIDPKAKQSIPEFEPIYPLTHGVTQKVMAKATSNALERAPDLAEWIDPGLAQKEGWPTWKGALTALHSPKGFAETSPAHPARIRLAYDELLSHQVTLALARSALKRKKGKSTGGNGKLRNKVLGQLPYRPTNAQNRAATEISEDMGSPFKMNRLLQGDVGSGKTLVALLALLLAVEDGGQGVLMAPTGILARQHFESLLPLAKSVAVRIETLTGSDSGKAREKKLLDLANGEIDILIGTHAVFQKDVAFHDLRLAVIDEQHRFGVRERLELGQKGAATDVLVMTATPIPRSLALAQYGDMDVSILDEKPPGRQPISTAVVPMARLDEVISHLETATASGSQAYWVCPLVGESEVLDLTAAEERFKSLRTRLGEGKVALVHGQMADTDRDKAMADFVEGRASVLVATTVIEVGVNVPSATIMVIEQAERFGLAQLHQLRGRVGRGTKASTCLLLYQPPLSEGAEKRLTALRETEDGFEIAQTDLMIRGAGDVIGTAQSGLPRFKIADPERDVGLMQIAQTDARALLERDPDLKSDRGKAVKTLLWLMEQDKAIRLISVG